MILFILFDMLVEIFTSRYLFYSCEIFYLCSMSLFAFLHFVSLLFILFHIVWSVLLTRVGRFGFWVIWWFSATTSLGDLGYICFGCNDEDMGWFSITWFMPLHCCFLIYVCIEDMALFSLTWIVKVFWFVCYMNLVFSICSCPYIIVVCIYCSCFLHGTIIFVIDCNVIWIENGSILPVVAREGKEGEISSIAHHCCAHYKCSNLNDFYIVYYGHCYLWNMANEV